MQRSSIIGMLLAALSGAHTPLLQMWPDGHSHSRGHGRGVYSGRKPGNWGTNWLARLGGYTNGLRECARRRRQIAAGILKVS